MTKRKIPVFVHVPKTAGSTFRIAAERYLGAEKILWDYGPGSPVTSAVVKELLYEKEDIPSLRKAAASYRFVSGHFYSMKWKRILPNSLLIAFLRDPAQRVVSLFHHLRTYEAPELKEVSLHDWVESERSLQSSNHQVRIIGSIDFPPERIGQAEYDRAVAILDNEFEVCGITERFDESFLHIRNRLGWDGMQYEVKNAQRTSVSSEYELDAATLAMIRDKNAWDIKLYEHARAKFDALVASLGDDFQQQLLQFREDNARYQAEASGPSPVCDGPAGKTADVGSRGVAPAAPGAATEGASPVARSPIPVARAVAKAGGGAPRTRKGQYRGRLQTVKQNQVSGWAMSGARPEQPVKVQLLINGAPVRVAMANLMRKPLLERKVHPTGLCGFAFRLGSAESLKPGDEVLVRIQGTEHVIENCPYVFAA